MTVKEILESYEEITVEEQILEGVLFFTLFEKKFLFFAPNNVAIAHPITNPNINKKQHPIIAWNII